MACLTSLLQGSHPALCFFTRLLLKERFFQFVDAENSREAKTRLEDFRYFARGLGLAEFRDCLRSWEEYILNSFD